MIFQNYKNSTKSKSDSFVIPKPTPITPKYSAEEIDNITTDGALIDAEEQNNRLYITTDSDLSPNLDLKSESISDESDKF